MIIAGTGHRPFKLVGHETCVQAQTVEYLNKVCPSEVISGMADGFDTTLALAALELDVPLTCAIPFRGHGSRVAQDVYDFIIKYAYRVVHVSNDIYRGPWQLLKRNEWMVDNCDRLATCWDGTKGGTSHCIGYARKVGRIMDAVWGKDPNVKDS